MNPVLTQRLVAIAEAASAAGHGNKEAVYQAACEELCMSRATLLKKLNAVRLQKPRKQRSDAGDSALTREEAMTISGTLMETIRGTGKRTLSVEKAINSLRDNGLIVSGRLDETTGEIVPLSASAIIRALRQYRLHPDQLRAPAPAVQLASRHPNHVWQLDASICVLYYLKNPAKGVKGDTGLRIMDEKEFNKNKPANVAKVVNDRVWSFEGTDHTTGWIYLEYRFGGETTENFTSVLINMMQERGGADVLHGVPKVLFTDPGAALKSPTMGNLCQALGIRLIAHKARNARATGSVEKARDILERDFEHGLRFCRVESIDELNRLARLWRMKFNRTAIHSRYGMARTDKWLLITEEQLVKAPSVEVCREAAVSAPVSCKVDSFVRVRFRGRQYDVSAVPGVCVNDRVMVARNLYRDDQAQVVMTGEDGLKSFFLVDEVQKDEHGFAVDAPVIGESFKPLPQTVAQQHLDEVEQHVFGTASKEETEAARKGKALPFGGRFNPYLDIERDDHPTYLPKRGQESQVRGPRIEQRPLSHVEAAKLLRERLTAAGHSWFPEHYAQMVSRFPEGVPAEDIDAIAQELAGNKAPRLSIVNGH
ncbi:MULTISPECIES: DDE-type integrase/transposase/recombinase [Klebsiella]|uniref:DDE-type integrase/transposase/recombinase n=1 Tax=Klebsiella TaxID=570 RepID=UPI000FFE765C|nr:MULTISPECIES: DDE-type integrase/transposase/recombinase [Klebsiella]MEB2923030.1 DDE-type integrase/transposase/recombinase [Klebsiella oxytoca]HEG4373997.1 DDE-type integrase/transposase/recombinase [Klebsiella oxytoca]